MKIGAIKKEYLVAALLIGVLCMIIVWPAGDDRSSEKTTDENTAETVIASSVETAEEELEERLEQMLGNISGVGQAKVFITWKSTREKVVEKDVTSSQSGDDDQTQSDTQEETVFEDTENGSSPYVVKELSPVVKGVLVVCEGGDDPVVVQNISESIMALFSIESHKIKVVRMKEG